MVGQMLIKRKDKIFVHFLAIPCRLPQTTSQYLVRRCCDSLHPEITLSGLSVLLYF